MSTLYANILEVIFIGIVIGLFTSVPVGPLGILTIQRTLNRGRWHGLLTGCGAAFSDLIYAAMVGFSMSFITDFINAHQMWIQLFGSIIIMFFGIHVFRKNPAGELTSASKSEKSDYFSDFISAFGLCFSNPLIIFIFIGLFARFDFFAPEQAWYENIIGLGAIFAGAASWWFTLTFLVDKLRSRFNVRGLWILNKITGACLIILGLITAITAL